MRAINPILFSLGFVFVLLSCHKTSENGNIGLGSPTDTVGTPLNITIASISPTHGPYQAIDTITGAGLEKITTPDSVLINECLV